MTISNSPLSGGDDPRTQPGLGPQAFGVDGAWLDSAYYHPMSLGAVEAATGYLRSRMGAAASPPRETRAMQTRVRAKFAALIGAQASEIAFTPSATVAENLVVAALRLAAGSRVVTDVLHYHGSLRLYEGLRARGVEVEVLAARGGRIDPGELAAALVRRTDLVAVSAVSQVNGFEHDLTGLCRLAHASGAWVYADIIQVAGAKPFDVRASGVDFCGASSYKWLMGDQGLGFLYVRADRLEALHQPQFGSRQADLRLNGDNPTAQRFEVGTINLATAAALDVSLSAILSLTPSVIAERRAPLLARLRDTLPGLGLDLLTPPGSNGPLVSFGSARAARLVEPLNAAGVFVSVHQDRIRVAPSVFNTHEDLDRLFAVVAHTLS
uniref:Aminotransferase class V n=1 Tax=Caulobacter sp. (strain K31) TaxID=366602 RepID=B0T923_CAUSK